MAHKASDIAKIILKLSNPDVGDIISNLKLQKLLYYVQGFALAMYDKPLFDEDIEAWMYGPVVPCVYQEYKEFGSGAIEFDSDFEIPKTITEEDISLIKEVYDVYGQYSALKLMNLTHDESPWKSTQTGQGNVIEQAEMLSYFKTRIC